MKVSEELMDRMIDAFGWGWRVGTPEPDGDRRRAGLKAALALIETVDTPEPPPICEVRVGDTLIVAYEHRLTQEQMEYLRRATDEGLPEGSTMFVLDGVSQIGVVRGS